MNKPRWITSWFKEILGKSSFSIRGVDLASSKEWMCKNGKIYHRSGKFFSIIGIEWNDREDHTISQPLIDQQEIGTLGFLINDTLKQPELLVQAKIEPGNVNAVQFGPSCQATASNIARVHGGDTPPLSPLFMKRDHTMIYESLQSEHGIRFYKKRNRNVLKKHVQSLTFPETHKWVRIDELLELLSCDFLVNTDARSVLVCSPWDQLVDRPVFSRYKHSFAKDLMRSAQAKEYRIQSVYRKLNGYRKKIKSPEIVPLDTLPDWKITSKGIVSKNKESFMIRHIKVVIHGREVPTWDQPVIDTPHTGYIDLICGRNKGILHFLFNLQIEPGLYNLVEFGLTSISTHDMKSAKGKIVLECKQSEEGGRFFQDINHYKIIDVGETYEVPESYQWLNLRQVRLLLAHDGIFTNEARSALSLLLVYL